MTTLSQRLPGILFDVKDGGLVPIPFLPNTDRLLIIGNALDGPINQPVAIRSLNDAESVYGPLTYTSDYVNPINSTSDGAYADNNLVKAVIEALQGGAGDVICCRVGGTQATNVNTLSASVTLYGAFNGRVYNTVSLVVASGSTAYTVTLNQPPGKGPQIVWTLANTLTMGDFVNTINNDSRNSSLLVTIPFNTNRNVITNLGVGTVYVSGGTAGTNGTSAAGEDYASSKANYYTALTQSGGTFDTLVSTQFDVAVLAGIYGDDQVTSSNATTTSVAQDFATFLYKTSVETMPCYGVIGLRPTGLRSPSDLATFATNNYLNTTAGYYNQQARWISFGYFMNLGFYYSDPYTGNVVDVGRHLTVIAGPDLILSTREIGFYLENGAAVYAGMVTNLPAQSATTNKVLPNVKTLNGVFNKNTLETLNQGIGYNPSAKSLGSAAYTTFKTSNQVNAPIVVADNTAAQRTSDYRTLQIFRIVNLASSLCKAVLFPFIGEPNSPATRTAMKTQLTTHLQKMVDAGALLGGGNGFNFTISSDPAQNLVGEVTVTLFLKPSIAIRTIKIVINVGS